MTSWCTGQQQRDSSMAPIGPNRALASPLLGGRRGLNLAGHLAWLALIRMEGWSHLCEALIGHTLEGHLEKFPSISGNRDSLRNLVPLTTKALMDLVDGEWGSLLSFWNLCSKPLLEDYAGLVKFQIETHLLVKSGPKSHLILKIKRYIDGAVLVK